MPNGEREEPNPPIIIGDGSVYISVKSAKLAWRKWIYHAPSGFAGEAMSWSAPVAIRLKEARLSEERSYEFPNRAVKWSGLLVVEYSDGTRLQIGPTSADGLGATITSSRPLSDYRPSEEDGAYVLRVRSEAKVERVYYYRSGVEEPVDLFEARKPYRVMITYTFVTVQKTSAAERKQLPAKTSQA